MDSILDNVFSDPSSSVRTLHLFDFDDTIAFTSDEEFDEEALISPSENTEITDKLKDLLDAGEDVAVLSSRENADLIRNFLYSVDIFYDDLVIHALGDPNETAKGNYILENFDMYDVVILYDNNADYLKSASEVLEDSEIEFIPKLVVDHRRVKASVPLVASGSVFGYHGGPRVLSQSDILPGIMYFSPDKDFASGYSSERHGQSDPKVTKASLKMKNPARSDEAVAVMMKLGVDLDSDSIAALVEVPGVVDALKEKGFDSAILSDFGFDSDFDESDVYIVFDAPEQVTVLGEEVASSKKVMAAESWAIPPQLKDFYQVSDISNAPQWKAQVLVGNSGNTPIGTFESINYVLIDLDSNYIIPVAESDEHQRGLDILDYLHQAYNLPPGRYSSVAITLSNYLQNRNEESRALTIEAIKKWVGYGGSKVTVQDRTRNGSVLIDGETLVETGTIEPFVGSLSPSGQYIVDTFQYMSDLLNKILKADRKEPLIKKLNASALKLLQFLKDNYALALSPVTDLVRQGINDIMGSSDEDYSAAERVIFSHNGVKNSLHNKLRSFEKDPKDYDVSGYQLVFGDVAVAKQAFDAIDPGIGVVSAATKKYGYYMLCIDICNKISLEAKNDMVDSAVEVSREEFVSNCIDAEKLFRSESDMLDDPDHAFFKSILEGTPCYYLYYAGFEYVFLLGHTPTNVPWDEENDEDFADVSASSKGVLRFFEATASGIYGLILVPPLEVAEWVEGVNGKHFKEGMLWLLQKYPGKDITLEVATYLRKLYTKITGENIRDTKLTWESSGCRSLVEEAGKNYVGPQESFYGKDKASVVASGSSQDEEYMQAVESGDLEKAQSLVNVAAERAGYLIGPVQHGTNASFSEFDPQKIGKKWGLGAYGKGFYFTDDGSTAGHYGSKFRLNVFLKISNPYLFDESFEKDFGAIPKEYPPLFPSDVVPNLSALLRRKGFDGLIGKDTLFSSVSTGKEFVVYSPEQIKSAEPVTYDDSGEIIPLSKRFDSSSKDVRASGSSSDEEYLTAVESGDLEKASQMVKQSAEKAGYSVGPVYHGTTEAFSSFIFSEEEGSLGAYFSSSKSESGRYGDIISSYFLYFKSLLDLTFIPEVGNGLSTFFEFLNNKLNISFSGQSSMVYSNPSFRYSTLEYLNRKFNLVSLLKQKGYDGLAFNEINGVTFVVFSPEQIKSADPVVYDDSGNVIPLSDRFNSSSKDIRAALSIDDSISISSIPNTSKALSSFFSSTDSFYDLYPGYSEPIDEEEECMFESAEVAKGVVEDVLDVFEALPDPIPVYRAIYAKTVEDIDLNLPGQSWSFVRSSALIFGRNNGSNFLLRAFVPKSAIDWDYSVKNFAVFSLDGGDFSEDEVVVADESAVKGIKVYNIRDMSIVAHIEDIRASVTEKVVKSSKTSDSLSSLFASVGGLEGITKNGYTAELPEWYNKEPFEMSEEEYREYQKYIEPVDHDTAQVFSDMLNELFESLEKENSSEYVLTSRLFDGCLTVTAWKNNEYVDSFLVCCVGDTGGGEFISNISSLGDWCVFGTTSGFENKPGLKGIKASKRVTATPAEAWHGSPYEFNEFSLENVGAGEGNQSFGWGLYFTSKEEIADFYRNELTPGIRGKALINGEPVENTQLERYLMFGVKNGAVLPNALELALKMGQIDLESQQVSKVPGVNETSLLVNQISDWLDSGAEFTLADSGVKYKVTLWKNKQETLLDWDKGLKEMPQKVQEIVCEISKELVPEDETCNLGYNADPSWSPSGRHIYSALVSLKGSEKVASEYLYSKGIDGIKYLAEGSSGGSSGDAYNYVVFNDKDVTTEEVIQGKRVRASDHMDPALLEEAKNYDTAEEFIASQGEVLYHGTRKTFDRFPEGMINFLTDNKGVADHYSGNVPGNEGYEGVTRELYVKLKNPLIVDAKNREWNRIYVDGKWLDAVSVGQKAFKEGHDGAIIKNIYEVGMKGTDYLVFNPLQINSKEQLKEIWDKAHGRSVEASENTDPALLEEALKYNTAEDFVFSQMQKESGFKDSHVAPSSEEGPIEQRIYEGGDFSLAEVVQGYSSQPNDYLDPNAARIYGYNSSEGMESYAAIRRVKDGQSTTIMAYRAVPSSVPVDKLECGDWVSFSKKYAENHGNNRFDGNYKLIEQEVTPDEVWWDGNDLNEWGYDNGQGDSRTTVTGREKQLTEIWNEAHGKKVEASGDVDPNIYSYLETYSKDNTDLEEVGDLWGVEVDLSQPPDVFWKDMYQEFAEAFNVISQRLTEWSDGLSPDNRRIAFEHMMDMSIYDVFGYFLEEYGWDDFYDYDSLIDDAFFQQYFDKWCEDYYIFFKFNSHGFVCKDGSSIDVPGDDHRIIPIELWFPEDIITVGITNSNGTALTVRLNTTSNSSQFRALDQILLDHSVTELYYDVYQGDSLVNSGSVTEFYDFDWRDLIKNKKVSASSVLPLLSRFPDVPESAMPGADSFVAENSPEGFSLDMYKYIPLKLLVPMEPLSEKDMDKVESIKSKLLAGEEMPPLIVTHPSITPEESKTFCIHDGHHRYLAYRDLGEISVPCAIVSPETDLSVTAALGIELEVDPDPIENVEEDIEYVNSIEWFHGNRGSKDPLSEPPVYLSSSKVVAELFAGAGKYVLEVNGEVAENISYQEATLFSDAVDANAYTPDDIVNWGINLFDLEDPEIDGYLNDALISLGYSDVKSVILLKKDEAVAGVFSGRISLDSLKVVDYKGSTWGTSDTFLDKGAMNAKNAGYPAFLGKNVREGGVLFDEDFPMADTLVVFDLSIVKNLNSLG